MSDVELRIVRMRTSHRPLVARSWLTSYWHQGNHAMRGMPPKRYYDAYEPIIDAVLDRETTWCAVTSEDEDQVMGWVCAASSPLPSLQYVYVKKLFRDPPGLAERLLLQAAVVVGATGFTQVAPVDSVAFPLPAGMPRTVWCGIYMTPPFEAFCRKRGWTIEQEGRASQRSRAR